MWHIRGRRWVDTLALWVNAVFWLPRRIFWQLRLGSKEAAIQKLLQNPRRHWTVWPVSLAGRYFLYKGLWIDTAGLTWFLAQQDSDMPRSWMEALSKTEWGIEIGAHRGYWLLAQKAFLPPSGRVIVFEPDAENFAYLTQNLKYNGAYFALPMPVAIWKEKSQLCLESPVAEGSEHASFGLRLNPQKRGPTLASTLDAILDALPITQITWIKIDAEGAEVAILEGACETLRRFHPTLWIEVHDTWEPLCDFLASQGYHIRDSICKPATIGPYKKIGYLWAEKKSVP